MPNVGQRKAPNFDNVKKKQANQKKNREEESKQKKSESNLMDDDLEETDTDDADEVIQASIKAKKEGKAINPRIAIGVIAIVIVLIVIILLFGKKKKPEVQQVPQATQPVVQVQEPEKPTEPDAPPDTSGMGTQDFTKNTTNVSSSALSDPNMFVKDLYGLTTSVNYEVADIQYIADFVNYTKHRGTWGGGIELYYLDVTYKNAKYVIQVPFRYYKELTDEGIIPVKMELLHIRNTATTSDNSYLTIISYMCLDSETLNSVMKSQSK